MDYVSRVPRPPLDRLIDDLYSLEGAPPYARLTLPPMPAALLIVNLGALAAGLVDEVRMDVVPVVFGSGKRYFARSAPSWGNRRPSTSAACGSNAPHGLMYTERPVLDLALEAQYDSHEAFTRAFGAAFGMPPRSFRDRRGSAARVEAPIDAHYRRDEGAKAPALLRGDAGALEGEVRRCPALRVAFIRHIGPYEEVPLVFGRLSAWAGSRGLLRPDAPPIGVAHDDPGVTPPERLRFDSCIAVPPDVNGEGKIGIQELPGGDYAIATHFGPFETLKETYQWLAAEFLPQRNRVLARRPAIEIYHADPERTRPCDLRTEIRLPLEEA